MIYPVTLGGSAKLLASMAMWKLSQKTPDRGTAYNVQEPPLKRTDSPLTRLHNRGQLDPDYFISELLLASGTRYFHDWHLAKGARGEVQERRQVLLQAANRALGDRYLWVVNAVVVEEQPISVAGLAAGYKNRSAASAVTLERLNSALRRLAVHYGTLLP